MHQWIDVFNKKDLRFILKNYDENITDKDLTPFFDKLIIEYEELSGSDEYSHYLAKMDDKLWKKFVIKACELTIIAINLGMTSDAELLIKDFNLRVNIDKTKLIDKDAILKLENKIKQIESIFRIADIEESKDNKNEKNQSWEDLIVDVDQILGIKVDYNCTVALYLSYKNRQKSIIAARNKKNG